MNRFFKTAIFCVVICMISLLFVSCGDKGDGDTSGNAQNGVISRDDGSKGGAVSEMISMGGEVVSKVEDAVSDIISDIMPDKSTEDSEESVSDEDPSDVSFLSEGEVSNV
ncbi:MAG: hypothetical protein E7614_07410 [Ruminococcaceae bacterium]|nr:hypothetical protein [Oscillospiraceae bacterium]